MEVKLDIDSANLGGTVQEVFNNLNTDEKKELAREVLLKFLQEPYDYERKVYEQQVVERLKKTDYHRNDSESQIRSSYRFREAMGSYKSQRDVMVEQIVSNTIEFFKNGIAKDLEEDEQIQKMRDEVCKYIKENFSKFVHDAMVAWFCGNMSSISNGIVNSLVQGDMNKSMIEEIKSSIGMSS